MTDYENMKAILKAYYREGGVENLLGRNSPVIPEIQKDKVEGKEFRFPALAGRGGAVSADYNEATSLASKTARNVEFVIPGSTGQIFSNYKMSLRDLEAARTEKGAYMKIAANKMTAAEEALRKTLGAVLYGRGYGEICATNYTTAITANTEFDLELPDSAIMAIDEGTVLALKSSVVSSTVDARLTVQSINGNTVKVISDTAVASPAATDVLCISGGLDDNGHALYPVGLGEWLPVVAGRSGTNWDTYVGTDFFGVNRSKNVERLCGKFYQAASGEKKSVSIMKLIKKVRQGGSKCDFIIMNDEDAYDVMAEVQTTNAYMNMVGDGKKKNTINVGANAMTFGFQTNWVENIYDDPFCPKGRFYVLEKANVGMITWSSTGKIDGSIRNNEPGAETVDAEGNEAKQFGLLIDDLLSVVPSDGTTSGPSAQVVLSLFGHFVVYNQAHCGVGEFSDSTDFALTQTA